MIDLEPSSIFKTDGENYENRIVADFAMAITSYTANATKGNFSLKNPDRKWRVSSALQKCIRRGHTDLADRYAQALINSGEGGYFWTRLPVIAFEDIGLGDPYLCALVLALSRYKKLRQQWDEGLLASFLCVRLAAAVKNRTLCDLACSIEFTRKEMGHVAASTNEFDSALKTLTSDYADPKHPGWYTQLVSRSYMAARLLGNREHERENNIEYTSPLAGRVKFLEFLSVQPEMSSTFFYMMYAGCKKGVHGLNEVIWPLIRTLPSDWATYKPIEAAVPEVRLICGVPDFAFDQHTLEGKKAIAYVCKSSPDLKNFFDSVECSPSSALGMVLFQVESALLDCRTGCPILEKITANNDCIEFNKVKLSIEQGMQLRKLILSEPVREELFNVRQKVTV